MEHPEIELELESYTVASMKVKRVVSGIVVASFRKTSKRHPEIMHGSE